ncbi:hypothetical protein S40288_04264 [Stachybotrys chartarum IBT 40288]|nr:hypothetical protein S40288_04264 [Stachybotrys chartarum IBT 40288]
MDEQTPLIRPDECPRNGTKRWPRWTRSMFGVENRILLAGFIITLSFSYTQVPLFYIFHLLECDAFYDTHPPYRGIGDRCSRGEIAAGTAQQWSLLGVTTTLCGTMNLFVAGWMVRKFGPRLALIVQTLIPAVRVAIQLLGVMVGKRPGMHIVHCSQLITVLGGPTGYILVINIIAGEVVEPLKRTATFGKLQGCIMLGQSLGYLLGGMIGDAFGIRWPFHVAFISFLLSATYSRLALPFIPSPAATDMKSGKPGVGGFLGPLKLLVPRPMRLANGVTTKHYGLIFLVAGIFLGVLATGYAPLLIQMYATAVFQFRQTDNGFLMSEFAFMRSLFLIFLFPRIIELGRRWWSKSQASEQSDVEAAPAQLPVDPAQFGTIAGEQTGEEPMEAPASRDNGKDQQFDLVFLRWSLVIDGALTAATAFATRSWHIYLAAFFLPFGSGSAPAAKGVVTAMCTEAQRADALNVVTLIENIAVLSTQGLFGFIFAALAQIDMSYATFYCNAALAVVAMLVSMLSRFPPPGSTLVESDDDDSRLA